MCLGSTMVYDSQKTQSGSTIGTCRTSIERSPIILMTLHCCRFNKELEGRQLNFAVIAGSSWEQRTKDAIRCVEEFMKNK